ncbi:MAG: hypothetical protein KAT06_01770 [Gammaproteobacteria bacterium]|nr:hypothetical protein [Gammaproteobacteria bacterium]
MKKQFTTSYKIISLTLVSFLVSQPVMAAKFKCWTNSDGVKECGSYVPAEYSQKRIETRGDSGRVVEVKERARTKSELAEIDRLAKLKEIEDAKIAEQKKKDNILLKTFSSERDINMLRDSKVNVIEGILTVTNSNNKALHKKLEKLQKRAANSERRGKKPPQRILDDIKAIESRLNKNSNSIKSKREEQKIIRAKFAKDLKRFRKLKNIKEPAEVNKAPKR